jgi:hypothetical protein
MAIAREATNTKGNKTGLPRRTSANTNWKKLLLVDRASSILQDSVKCALHKISEVKQDTFVNFALFHSTEVLILRNTTQLGTARLST